MTVTNQEGLAAEAGDQEMARHIVGDSQDQGSQQQQAPGAAMPAKGVAKIRGGRWRLLKEQGEGANDCAFKLSACTTLKQNGVLAVDFGKLVSATESFVTFTVADGDGQDRVCYPLPRLCLPDDIKDLVLRRLISAGLPLLASYCDASQILNAVAAYDGCWCGANAYTKFATANALAEIVRLHNIQHRNRDIESPIRRDTEICDIANIFNRVLLAMSVLVAVHEQVACHMADADTGTVASLRDEILPVITRLAACRQCLLEVRRLLGLDGYGYEF